MSNASRGAMGFIGFLVIIALGAGVYYGLLFVLNLFQVMDRQVAAIMAVVVITALFCARIIASGLRESKSRQLLSTEKLALYKKLINHWNEAIINKQSFNLSDSLLEQEVILIAGSRVLKQLHALKDTDKEELLILIDKLIREMRKDLGQRNTGLSKESFLL